MDSDKGVNQGNNVNNGSAAGDTQPSGGAACGETEMQSVTKRPIKLTQKALFDKFETIQGLMQDREYETEVHCAFDKYKTVQ